MRAMTCAAAALVMAFMLGCDDRERQDAAGRIDNAAEEAGDEMREGAEEVGDAAEDAADDLGDYSYDRREEFRGDVRTRLDRLDSELAELEREIDEDATEAHKEAVAAAREARSAAQRSFDRLGDATASNWEQVKGEVREALEAAELRLRELRPDAKPMGGTGGPG